MWRYRKRMVADLMVGRYWNIATLDLMLVS